MEEENIANNENEMASISEIGAVSSENTTIDESKSNLFGKKTGLFLEKLELEIKNGYRLFTYKEQPFKILMSSVHIDTMVNEFKTKIVSKLLKDKDIMMKDEIMKNLRERGVWDDSKQKTEKELRDRISRCISDMMTEKSKDEPDKDFLLEKMKEKMSLEIDLEVLSGNKDNLLQSTIENKVDEEVTKYKLTLLVKTIDDVNVWKSVEEFENHPDKAFVNSVTVEAIYFWAGLDQSMFGLAPDFS
jgi:hypothetical protein